ncbi:MAG TPA: discoidin domain-containing protein, partial [Polyangia bacterium]|nr:discoidin domain-containing protein [Polyangia bacterium]
GATGGAGAGAAGASGGAGAGAAGASGGAGAGAAGASGSAGGAAGGGAGAPAGGADGGADARDAGTTTPDAPPATTDPCDHRTWTFTPSVVCTTACAAMPDGQKLPANAIDGDTTTRYTTGISQGSKGPEVVILSFPQNVTLTGLNLFTKSGDGPFSYLVESSLDGANFSYFMPSAAGLGSDNLTVTFPSATKLRAMRITQTGVKKTNWWSIHELTVKGCVATP